MAAPSNPGPHLSGEQEEIHYFADPVSGLKAIVVLDDTSAGPALGGIRCTSYADEAQALADVCALARGMTYKALLAELPAGGGKAVILDHPKMDRRAAFAALGERIERMGGRFFTAADLGTGERDLAALGTRTRFVATKEHGVDHDLALRGAEGVFLAASTALDLSGIAEWKGQRIAIQGLGAIGMHVAMLALRAGARVVASDMNAERAGRAADTMPIQLVEPDRIYDTDCAWFAPCANGGIIDEPIVPRLRCRIVCGAANNQLASEAAGDQLAARGILYAPDLLVNAGALIMGCGPALPGFEPPRDLSGIARRLRAVLVESYRSKVPPHRIVLAKARHLLDQQRARRATAASG